jgi:hypothetical protein
MSNHFIIGCGGIGSWLVPLLLRTKPKEDTLVLMDGDIVEERNFDRQLFMPEHLGWNKAEALAATFGLVNVLPRYLQKSTRPEAKHEDWIWCCVDNHPARAECLAWVDDLFTARAYVTLFLGGNEYEYQEAYVYRPLWKNLETLDPRLRFPEILTDKSGDAARPSCTGLTQKENPQLALYNFLVAGSMVHLWRFQKYWLAQTDSDKWPISHSANHAKMQTMFAPTVEDLIAQHRNRI